MVSHRFQSYVKANRDKIDQTLERLLPPANEEPRLIHEAMRYSVFAGGKRLRPLLAVAAYQIAGRQDDLILPPACGLELVHTHSLIYDDLPCMDDDDLRRGQPTNHKVFGEAVAVLAGDALLSLAFECILGRGMASPPPEATLGQIARQVAYAVGSRGLVGGQVMDISLTGQNHQLSILETTYRMKTASLIEVSLQCGALLAEADAATRLALGHYGRALGMAFQITDDLLNVSGDAQKMGKAIHSDAAHQKATFPALLGVEAARAQAQSWIGQAKKAVLGFGDAAWFLTELADYVFERQS
jgi:geranylgeranyl diphosphate synthase, type II